MSSTRNNHATDKTPAAPFAGSGRTGSNAGQGQRTSSLPAAYYEDLAPPRPALRRRSSSFDWDDSSHVGQSHGPDARSSDPQGRRDEHSVSPEPYQHSRNTARSSSIPTLRERDERSVSPEPYRHPKSTALSSSIPAPRERDERSVSPRSSSSEFSYRVHDDTDAATPGANSLGRRRVDYGDLTPTSPEANTNPRIDSQGQVNLSLQPDWNANISADTVPGSIGLIEIDILLKKLDDRVYAPMDTDPCLNDEQIKADRALRANHMFSRYDTVTCFSSGLLKEGMILYYLEPFVLGLNQNASGEGVGLLHGREFSTPVQVKGRFAILTKKLAESLQVVNIYTYGGKGLESKSYAVRREHIGLIPPKANDRNPADMSPYDPLEVSEEICEIKPESAVHMVPTKISLSSGVMIAGPSRQPRWNAFEE